MGKSDSSMKRRRTITACIPRRHNQARHQNIDKPHVAAAHASLTNPTLQPHMHRR